MANSDARSSTTCTVRVLVSFYLAATDDSSSMAKPSESSRFIRQNSTKHAAGTLPLSMYRKELPVGDRVTEEPISADDIGDSCQSMILTPATKKTVPPTKKTRSRLFL